MSGALLSGSYRYDAGEWETADDGVPSTPDRLSATFERWRDPPALLRDAVRHSGAGRQPARRSARRLRRLRRTEDAMIYEPVLVGSVEDALLATIMNGKIEAVVIFDGIPVPSQHDVPLLRDLLASRHQLDTSSLAPREVGVTLARLIKRIRPELDLYLLTDRNVEKLAGDPAASMFRRVFYEVEELMEVHLNILEGVADRFSTPFFDNLKRYAARPIATFHALPIARGKSIMKSNWIRDMGEFYGQNLFLAESSATTGGLDSMLEPTGNIKIAQEKFARAVGADHVFFVTNGTSTSNKMVYQAVTAPGDIVIADRNCHKSHHYGMVLSGAQPLYVEAFPMTEYSMYGAVPLRTIKQAMLNLKAEGRLDRLKMVTLTNCTFDGHVYNTRRVMEECLAIKPDVIFLWDEAWFGFARWSPFLRPRTGLGAAAALEEWRASPAALEAWNGAGRRTRRGSRPEGSSVCSSGTWFRTRARSASACTRPTRCTSRCRRCARDRSWRCATRTTTTTPRPSAKRCSSTPRPRRTSRSSPRWTSPGARWSSKAMNSSCARSRLRLRSAGRWPNTRSSRSTSACSAPTPWCRPSTAPRVSRTSSPRARTWVTALKSVQEDEFFLDPTRMTLVCGTAGYDGTQFKGLLAAKYNIQMNKTSRNSVLLQSNINNTRSDVALLIKVLLEISQEIEARLAEGGESERAAFAARVKNLMDGRARPAELQPLPRRLSREPGQHHARRRHARRVLRRL